MLNNYNWKITAVPFDEQPFSSRTPGREKIRNARDASDTRPIETTYRQKAIDSAFGTFGWTDGPNPFWKFGDQHIFSDRWLLDVVMRRTWATTSRSTSRSRVSATSSRCSTRRRGVWARSFQQSVFLRPTNSVDIDDELLPARRARRRSLVQGRLPLSHGALGQPITHTGGNADARVSERLPERGTTSGATLPRRQRSIDL